MAADTRVQFQPWQSPDVQREPEMKPISGSASKPQHRVLLLYNELPEWFKQESNRWIHHGYWPISASARLSFSSWLYIHNETINIYSHLIPAILFLLTG
jgi:adiponectin receptor